MLILLFACTTTDIITEHCDVTPVDVANDEDIGLGITAEELVASMNVGPVEFTITADVYDSVDIEAPESTTSSGTVAVTRGSGSATFEPASDEGCANGPAQLTVPIVVDLVADDASIVVRSREGVTQVSPNTQASLGAPISQADFSPTWAGWIADAETAATSVDDCEMDDPWITPAYPPDAPLIYTLQVTCPNRGSKIADISIWLTPTD